MKKCTFEKGTPFYNAFNGYYQILRKYIGTDLLKADNLFDLVKNDFSFVTSICPCDCYSYMKALQFALEAEILRCRQSNISPETIRKGCFYYELIADYVPIVKKYIDGDEKGIFPENDEFWEAVITEVDYFYANYKSTYAKDLALAFVGELDRRYHSRICLCA